MYVLTAAVLRSRSSDRYHFVPCGLVWSVERRLLLETMLRAVRRVMVPPAVPLAVMMHHRLIAPLFVFMPLFTLNKSATPGAMLIPKNNYM